MVEGVDRTEPARSAAAAPIERRTALAALIALSAAAFAFVTTELAPVGLLPLLADDLHTSLSTAGVLVTVYAVTVAVTAVPLTQATKRIPRRWLLTALLSIFVLATVISAAAPTYWVLMISRVVLACAQAVYWSVAQVAAAGLFPPEVRGRVTVTVVAGASLAPVAGVPAVVWIGQHFGWRVAFLAIGALALAALVAILMLFPTMDPEENEASSGANPDRRRFWTIAAATCLAVTGMFTAYTYISPLLTDVSGFSEGAVSPLLLVFGLAGFIGVGVAALFVDRAPRLVITCFVGLLAAALLTMFPLGPVQWAAVVLLILWGFAFPPLPASLSARILEVAPGSSDVANAMITVAFNIGIGGGALLGGVLLPHTGVRSTTLVGGLIAATAFAVLLSEPRRRPQRA
jgi:DHA1 family inner membrane transport protein